MTKTAIIKGVARWYGKHVCPKMPPFSLMKIVHLTAVNMAEANPSVVETCFLNFIGPKLAGALNILFSAAEDDEFFKAAVTGLAKTFEKEPLEIDLPATVLRLGPSDALLIAGEIRTAQTEIENAGAAASAAGGGL